MSGYEPLRAEVLVGEGDGFAVGDSEAIGGVGEGCSSREVWPAVAVVDGLRVFFFVWGLGEAGEVFAGAGASVEVTCCGECLEGFAVERQAFALIDDWALPHDAQPM